ncbi:hypothetical protein GA0115240_11446 [Streptomyces sp. DvalAA-14]|uniref:hypothetical protein n=1 Tax=unclassified Streptomyces TaxID=2593676 RepID=UPI00081B1BD9|nr:MULTISPECIES: hypothetical protein [unclassified Streptomyces]MYS19873.1 hypothetical protein [Streptomyces sp. SID4948]SCD55453.1 hypothetical protein GA0115240_11446 [Streptomyces sp. DvalAA-14]
MVEAKLPEQGVVFWPVGTGDSTTLVLGDNLVVQVDLRDMAAADGDGAVVAAVVDRLEDTLPRPDGTTPYLAVFALTHADLDHCCGFGDLLDSSIVIGEIWATPRLWREISEDGDMCEDARRFQDEVERRVQATLKALKNGQEPDSGDRVRIIGYDEDRTEHSYAQLPDKYFTFPGKSITMVDGNNVADRFEAFVHAPFKGDCAGDRNDTSLALQIQMHTGGTTGRLLLLGDLAYVTIKKIFDFSEFHNRTDRVEWDVLLSPHHCSKKVMYAPGEDGTEELKQDILDQLAAHASPDARVIASSRPFRDKDEKGHNPPHLLARDAYEAITAYPVLCTGEYPTAEEPRPVVFALEPSLGFELVDLAELEHVESKSRGLTSAGGGRRLLADLGTTRFSAVTAGTELAAPRGTDAARAGVQRARGDQAEPAVQIGFGAA